MADDETQGPEVTSWWASDALHDSSLPSSTFDEPLVWPEAPTWDDMEGVEAADGGFDALVGPAGAEADLPFPPVDHESDAQWRPSEEPVDPDATVQHAQPLAGLGGGAAPARTAPNVSDELQWPSPVGTRSTDLHTGGSPRPPELGSIWSNDFRSEPENLVGFAGLPAPAIYADTERSGARRRWPNLDIRPGNAAVIGLISVVSLVLLGMFLSVRARNDSPTDASQARPAGDEISVTGPLSTVPLTTPSTATSTSTSTTLVPAINISDLLPSDATTGAAPSAGSGGGSGTATATTAPPRAAAPTGGGGSTVTTTATTQPPAAPAPPATTQVTSPPATSPPDTSPPDTSPPDTTPTTNRPPPTAPPVSFTVPTYTIPTFPGLPARDRDN